jgi:hypothetical protein
MKTHTGWWGMEFIAESLEDHELLRALFNSLWKSYADDDDMELVLPVGAYCELKFYKPYKGKQNVQS